jgi:hypothetical protein
MVIMNNFYDFLKFEISISGFGKICHIVIFLFVVIVDYDLRGFGIFIATIDIVNKIEYNSIIKY